MRDDDLWALIAIFVPFSLMSIGGGSAIMSGMQHESVVVHGWISPREFIDLFAVSRAAPGPGIMLATLIGWKVAGWLGAFVASMAMFLPSSLLCYAVVRLSNTHRDKTWHKVVREGLAPVGVGLMFAGAVAIFRLSEGGLVGAAIATVSTAILMLVPRFPMLGVLALGGLTTVLIHQWPVL